MAVLIRCGGYGERMTDFEPRATFQMMGEFGCDFPLWYFGNMGRDTLALHPMLKSELAFWAGYFDNFAELSTSGEIVLQRGGDAPWYSERGRALAESVAEALGPEFAIELDLSDSAPVTQFRSRCVAGTQDAARSAHELVDAKESRDARIQALKDSGKQLGWRGLRPPHDLED